MSYFLNKLISLSTIFIQNFYTHTAKKINVKAIYKIIFIYLIILRYLIELYRTCSFVADGIYRVSLLWRLLFFPYYNSQQTYHDNAKVWYILRYVNSTNNIVHSHAH